MLSQQSLEQQQQQQQQSSPLLLVPTDSAMVFMASICGGSTSSVSHSKYVSNPSRAGPSTLRPAHAADSDTTSTTFPIDAAICSAWKWLSFVICTYRRWVHPV
jgi:hypothetical protein